MENTYRMEVGLSPQAYADLGDAEGNGLMKRANSYFGMNIDGISVIHVKTIHTDALTKDEIDETRANIFTDPVSQISSLNGSLANYIEWDYAILVSPKPGVTDPAGGTAKEAMERYTGKRFSEGDMVSTSKLYLISGDVTEENMKKLSEQILSNHIVQNYRIYSKENWDRKNGIGYDIPEVVLSEPSTENYHVETVDELMDLSDENSWALRRQDCPVILNYFNDPKILEERAEIGLSAPTDIEFEMIAQRRSDHCNHNTTNGSFNYSCTVSGESFVVDNFFDEYIRNPTVEIAEEKEWVVKVLDDNAGTGVYDEGLGLNYTITVESHCSPCAKEGFGGAATGIGGIPRDNLGTGLGSKVKAAIYWFCEGFREYAGKLKPELHPRRQQDDVARGINKAGNKLGFPTIYGGVTYDNCWLGKPIIVVGSVGVMPAEIDGEPSHEKHIDDGDHCVMVGGRIGRDGIHGVTAASEELSEKTPAGHVQIAYPYLQKKMEGALLEARDRGLVNYTTDNGGGGLSSSVGETAEFTGQNGGVDIDLDLAPTKYPNLAPKYRWISESQERMTLAIAPENWEEFLEVCRKHDVEATRIGTYRDTGKVNIRYKGETIAYMDIDFFKRDFPQWKFNAEWTPPEERGLYEPKLEDLDDYTGVLLDALADPNVCSTEWINRQFDHEVCGGSIIKPFVGEDRDVYSDAAVSKLDVRSDNAFAITQVNNPWVGEIDTYDMTALVIDEAVRRLISVGGRLEHIGGIDNFFWPDIDENENNPLARYKAAQLVRTGMALKDTIEAYRIPLLSGKDSMYLQGKVVDEDGETHLVEGKPLFHFTANSVFEAEKAISMDAKFEDDLVYVIGTTRNEMGGSLYYRMLNEIGLNSPKTRVNENLPAYQSLERAIYSEMVNSSHTVSGDGLAIELAKVAFAGNLGMDVDLSLLEQEGIEKNYQSLFSASGGRLIVTVSPEYKVAFENEMVGIPCSLVGRTTKSEFTVRNDDSVLIRTTSSEMKGAYKSTYGDLV